MRWDSKIALSLYIKKIILLRKNMAVIIQQDQDQELFMAKLRYIPVINYCPYFRPMFSAILSFIIFHFHKIYSPRPIFVYRGSCIMETNCIMGSLDVDSLFINIPLDEQLNIV